jgi:hypothetical protein
VDKERERKSQGVFQQNRQQIPLQQARTSSPYSKRTITFIEKVHDMRMNSGDIESSIKKKRLFALRATPQYKK